MANIFLISDTHFSHAGVCTFTEADGVTKIRPWTDPDEMDEELVKRWNSVVRPQDKVYHLGDVVIKEKALNIMYRLNGDKVLIRGNHDIFDDKSYNKHFRSLRGCHVLDGMIMTHIPIHSDSMGRFKVNIHGHLHTNQVMLDGKPDPRYFSVCVERIDYTPISLEDIKKRIASVV